MSEEVKILDSYLFKTISVEFSKKVENHNGLLEDALDENASVQILQKYLKIGEGLIAEYKQIAKALEPYGDGLKSKQFLERHFNKIDDLKDLMNQADKLILSRSA